MEDISSLVAEAKRSKYSLTNHLSEEDVLTVWDGLSDFIEKQMLQNKGVNLSGFGTFTFSKRKVDIGLGKVSMILRPVFSMSESFIQTHSLIYSKQLASGEIPVVSLNFTVLSNGTPYNRDTVELAIREIFQALGKSIASSKNITVDFPKIGKLLIKEKRCQMVFFKGFLRCIDSTGKMEYAFKPSKLHGSEGSVMSDPFVKSKALKMLEHSCESDISTCTSTHSSEKISQVVLAVDGCFSKNEKDKDTCRPSTPFNFDKPTVEPSEPSHSNTSSSHHVQNNDCSHLDDKSSLCYVCHQREMRNVPLYLAEEKKSKEKLHERLLYEFQQKKTAMLLAREKARILQSKENAKDAAEFNLNATKKRKLHESKDSIRNSNYHPSCIFLNRPLTPCFTRKQAEYCRQLDEQIRRRRDTMVAFKKQEEDKEKDEQDRLSKELSVIKEAHKEKMKNLKANYLQSLNDQVHCKTLINQSTSPSVQPVFEVQERVPSSLKIEENPKNLYQEQLAMFLEKQQAKKIESLKEKEEDARQLQLNLIDYKHDIQKSRLDRCEARRHLEEYWREALKNKQQESLSMKYHSFPSFLLHDQCKKYHRCRQCQRKVDNTGRSNILSETRYTSGARLIV